MEVVDFPSEGWLPNFSGGDDGAGAFLGVARSFYWILSSEASRKLSKVIPLGYLGVLSVSLFYSSINISHF